MQQAEPLGDLASRWPLWTKAEARTDRCFAWKAAVLRSGESRCESGRLAVSKPPGGTLSGVKHAALLLPVAGLSRLQRHRARRREVREGGDRDRQAMEADPQRALTPNPAQTRRHAASHDRCFGALDEKQHPYPCVSQRSHRRPDSFLGTTVPGSERGRRYLPSAVWNGCFAWKPILLA